MTRRKLHPWVAQLVANGDPWNTRTDPTCNACEGTGQILTTHGVLGHYRDELTECWDCQGTGTLPLPRKETHD